MLDKQIRKFQIPFYEEIFDAIKIYDLHKKHKLSVPEMIQQMDNFDQQNPHHTMTLDKHCRNTYELFCKKNYPLEFNIAVILHDYGKLFCKTTDENCIAHFYDHNSIGSYLVLENLVGEYKYGLLDICFLINYHMMPFSWDTDKAKQRWKERFGEYKYKMLLDFNECDRAR